MEDTPKPARLSLRNLFKTRLMSGLLVLVPIGFTLMLMRWILTKMAGFLRPFFEKGLKEYIADVPYIGSRPEILIMAMSILAFLGLLYLTGLFAQAVIGRRIIRLAESIVMKVPLAKTIYSSTKQVMEAVALPQQANLRSVVLVEFPKTGAWSFGFMTGRFTTSDSLEMARVFIPTTPNPTTGFLIMVPFREVITTSVTVEDAFKTMMSGGIVSCPDLENVITADRLTQKNLPR